MPTKYGSKRVVVGTGPTLQEFQVDGEMLSAEGAKRKQFSGPRAEGFTEEAGPEQRQEGQAGGFRDRRCDSAAGALKLPQEWSPPHQLSF